MWFCRGTSYLSFVPYLCSICRAIVRMPARGVSATGQHARENRLVGAARAQKAEYYEQYEQTVFFVLALFMILLSASLIVSFFLNRLDLAWLPEAGILLLIGASRA